MPDAEPSCPNCRTLKIQTAAEQTKHSWHKVRRLILFYSLYLASVLPLAWVRPDSMLTSLLFVSILDAGIIMLFWRWSGTSLRGLFHWPGSTSRELLLWLLGLLLFLLANVLYSSLLRELLPGQPADRLVGKDVNTMFLALVALCVMPAIWEEIAFRGIIQEQLLSLLGAREALLITAMLFAVIHRSLYFFPYLWLLGLFLGHVRRKSNSLIPGMAIHFLHNLAALFLKT